VAAYDQLLAQGLVEARKNRGFFVREATGDGGDEKAAPAGTDAAKWSAAHWLVARRAPGPVNATALIRGMFHKISDKPQPGMGVFRPTGWSRPSCRRPCAR
jgi:hypothetical protein